MDCTQFSIFMLTMIGLFLAHRSDIRMLLQIIRSIEQEMKDFHGRLCAIGEKGKK